MQELGNDVNKLNILIRNAKKTYYKSTIENSKGYPKQMHEKLYTGNPYVIYKACYLQGRDSDDQEIPK